MTDPDASWNEMTGIPPSNWLGHEADEPLLDMVLDGRPLPPQSPNRMHALQDRLAELAAPAGPGELTGEAAALAAFARARSSPPTSPVSISPPHRKSRTRRSGLLTTTKARLATAALTGGLALSGIAAAGYANALPTAMQQVAHTTIGAPAPNSTATAKRHHGRIEHGKGLPPGHVRHPARGHHGHSKAHAKPHPSHPAHPAKGKKAPRPHQPNMA